MNETDKILLAIEDFFQCYPLLDTPFDIKLWEKAYQSDFPSSTNQPASNEMLEIWCRNNQSLRGQELIIDMISRKKVYD